jgi:hypothetical protein
MGAGDLDGCRGPARTRAAISPAVDVRRSAASTTVPWSPGQRATVTGRYVGDPPITATG